MIIRGEVALVCDLHAQNAFQHRIQGIRRDPGQGKL